jgi:hypothetical protein
MIKSHLLYQLSHYPYNKYIIYYSLYRFLRPPSEDELNKKQNEIGPPYF